MKKTFLILILSVFVQFQLFPVFAESELKYPASELVLNNFVDAFCHRTDDGKWMVAKYPIINLDPRSMNQIKMRYAIGCKGQNICWSWIMSDYEMSLLLPGLPAVNPSKAKDKQFSCRLVSSTLPLKISNVNRLSESVNQTIKESSTLRKSTSSLVSAAQEFLNSSFGAGKERGVTKERSMTQSESRERATELDITPQFHLFLTKALSGVIPAIYPLCMASAADLFLQAYEKDRVYDLIQAFVVYKTIKPEDLDFSAKNDMLNRAKFLLTLIHQNLTQGANQDKKDFAWAQVVLFAKILEWPEFHEVKKAVDSEIVKAYNKYQSLLQKTTFEIANTDSELAAAKYIVDKFEISKIQDIEARQNHIRDIYAAVAIVPVEENIYKQILPKLKDAMNAKDPLLYERFVFQRHSKITLVPIFVFVIAIAIAIILFLKRRRKPTPTLPQ